MKEIEVRACTKNDEVASFAIPLLVEGLQPFPLAKRWATELEIYFSYAPRAKDTTKSTSLFFV